MEDGQQVFLVASDIVDYFPSIDLDLGLMYARRFVSSLFGWKESQFIMFSIKRILEHKFFKVCLRRSGGRTVLLLHKLRSLSIGEHIATAFANILRHALTIDVVDSSPFLIKHWGFVDDTLSILVCNQNQMRTFVSDLDSAIAPLRWVHEIDTASQHFLDIDITVMRVGQHVWFETGMYRKPNFEPHYLAAMSNHPASHKSGIFSGETFRALILCSKQNKFHGCIKDILRFLGVSGYPQRCFVLPSFDLGRRDVLLNKITSRKSEDVDRVTAKRRHEITLALPYTSQLASIKVASLFRSSLGLLLPIHIKLGWSVKINSMRSLYRLNWPG